MYLFEIIAVRALVLLLGVNLAGRLGLLPDFLGPFSFLPFFNILVPALTLLFLVIARSRADKRAQLFLHIATDLILATVLVFHTRGIESPFVSLYLFIIIYCCLNLGRTGGTAVAALSTILYAGAITAGRIGIENLNQNAMVPEQATFRIAAHALGFWAVAFLGTYLHKRLQSVESQLEEKIESLSRLRKLNEHIVRSIRSGLVTTDLGGRIAVFNSAAEELTGRKAEEVIDEPIDRIIGEDLWKCILESDLLENAKAMRREIWISQPGGAKRFLGFSVSPLMDHGHRLLGYILSFQDLTEIMRLEEEIRLKDRMAAIGRMAAGIAHEIRNPLAAMQGSVEILRSHATLPEVDERLLEILIRESDRLNKFVEDFLNFARPRKYAKHPIDIVPLLEDSVTLMRNTPEIRQKHSVVLHVGEPRVRVQGSADQLNQVFWNLAQNAIRAMPNGGELRIGVGKNREGGGLIEFEDTGIGISPEDRERLFQPFHSQFREGLGLGLSIIFQIMEDHRGKVYFESEPGKGTKVSLSFPPEERYDLLNSAEAGIH
ncbi:MAG: PAS domain S-box protein [Acidobacteria bacterium]|nr:PAS domain S-box protein [Acidobacteriota bacterium]